MKYITLVGKGGEQRVFECTGDPQELIKSLLKEEKNRRDCSISGDRWKPGCKYEHMNRCFQRPLEEPITVLISGPEAMSPWWVGMQ